MCTKLSTLPCNHGLAAAARAAADLVTKVRRPATLFTRRFEAELRYIDFKVELDRRQSRGTEWHRDRATSQPAHRATRAGATCSVARRGAGAGVCRRQMGAGPADAEWRD